MSLAQSDPFAEDLAVSLYEEDADVAEGILTELKRGWEVDKVLAKVRQQRIAAATAQIEHAAVEGLGELTMQIDATAFHYWGQRLGYQCWEDATFRREFARDNPEVRVKNRSRRETIVKSRVLLTDRFGHVVGPQ